MGPVPRHVLMIGLASIRFSTLIGPAWPIFM
jgi:hypothetical protein